MGKKHIEYESAGMMRVPGESGLADELRRAVQGLPTKEEKFWAEIQQEEDES